MTIIVDKSADGTWRYGVLTRTLGRLEATGFASEESARKAAEGLEDVIERLENAIVDSVYDETPWLDG